MIPGLYTYAATAIVAGVLAFGAGWQTQEWRYGKQIADIQAQHSTALASANQKALDDTIKMQRTKDEAIKAAQDRAKREAANAVAARSERDGLRAQLASATARANAGSATDPVACERAFNRLEELGGLAGEGAGLLQEARELLRERDTDIRRLFDQLTIDREAFGQAM